MNIWNSMLSPLWNSSSIGVTADVAIDHVVVEIEVDVALGAELNAAEPAVVLKRGDQLSSGFQLR